MDFSEFPIVFINDNINGFVDEDEGSSITTFTPLENNFIDQTENILNVNYPTTNVKLKEFEEPLSYFFEVLNISDNYLGFTVGSQLGEPLEYVLRGYVPPSEAKLGIPVVIDWETSWTKIMTDWFMHRVEAGDITSLYEDYERNYCAMIMYIIMLVNFINLLLRQTLWFHLIK